MFVTYQYKLKPTSDQVAIFEAWGELLRRHYNYALGQRLDWLNRTRTGIDRCNFALVVARELRKLWQFVFTVVLVDW